MKTYKPKHYDISDKRYVELLNFCLQYDELSVRHDKRSARKIAIIEEALQEACPNETVRFYLRNAIRWGLAYEKLGAIPLGRRQFYDLRRKFFHILDQKRG